MVSCIVFNYLIISSLFLWVVKDRDPNTPFCMWIFRFSNNIYWRYYPFPIFWQLCQKTSLIHMPSFTVYAVIYLDSLFCFTGLCACFYSSTILFLLLQLYNSVWNQKIWRLPLCSSFSRLLWLFILIVVYKF